MPKISGPITFGKNKPLPKEFLKEVKLPFKADNWQSTESKDIKPEPRSIVNSTPPFKEISSPVVVSSSTGNINKNKSGKKK